MPNLIPGDPMDKENQLETITIEDLCHHTGLRPSIAVRIVQLGILEPINETTPQIFHLQSILKIQKILRIKRDLKIGFSSMSLVLSLLERIEELEEHLRFAKTR